MPSYTRAMRQVLAITLAGNVGVAVLKLAAGWYSGSLSVLADGLDSGVDAAATVVLLLLLRVAVQPPDAEHPYGHSRFETVGAFALSGMLFVIAWEVLQSAVLRLLHPQVPHVTPLLYGVMLVSILVNLFISTYERRWGRALGSDMLLADSAHTRGDLFVGLGVVVGLVLTSLGYPAADPLIAVGVAGVIAVTGYRVVQDAFPVLTDRAVYDPDRVRRIVEAVPGVESVHDIRSRGRLREAFVQMHLIVEPRDVERAHAVTLAVEEAVMTALGAREVFVHVEPEDHGGPPLDPEARPRENPT